MGRNLKELGESDNETGNRESEQPTGLNHNLPDTAKPFFCSSHKCFMLLLQSKQICICIKRLQQRGQILFINISCVHTDNFSGTFITISMRFADSGLKGD